MAVNLDADIGQIVKNFLNKKNKEAGANTGFGGNLSFSQTQYKQAGIKCVIVICVTAILSWGIHMLTKSSVAREQSEFTSLSQLSAAVTKMGQDINSSRDLLDNNRKKVEEIIPMFSDTESSKSLFKLLSTLAEQNNLVIRNLSQGEVIETTSPAKFLQTKILLEIVGFYPNYIKFLKGLESAKPLIKVESEDLKLSIDDAGQRALQVSLSFIDYSVQKQEYEKILQK
jgi:hypothetical protein